MLIRVTSKLRVLPIGAANSKYATKSNTIMAPTEGMVYTIVSPFELVLCSMY